MKALKKKVENLHHKQVYLLNKLSDISRNILKRFEKTVLFGNDIDNIIKSEALPRKFSKQDKNQKMRIILAKSNQILAFYNSICQIVESTFFEQNKINLELRENTILIVSTIKNNLENSRSSNNILTIVKSIADKFDNTNGTLSNNKIFVKNLEKAINEFDPDYHRMNLNKGSHTVNDLELALNFTDIADEINETITHMVESIKKFNNLPSEYNKLMSISRHIFDVLDLNVSTKNLSILIKADPEIESLYKINEPDISKSI